MSNGCAVVQQHSVADGPIDADDKNRKANSVLLQSAAGCGFFSLRGGIGAKQIAAMKHNPFYAYGAFLMVFYVWYYLAGGRLSKAPREDILGCMSCIFEAAGLISLRWKISRRGHVNGLSGMSLLMFTLTYTMREYETFLAKVAWKSINGLSLEILQVVSCLLVYVNLWSVFKTYRSSYQEELDVLKVKYLVPGCVVLGLVLHPHFRQGVSYSMSWSMSFYVDVLALLPQIVMMQRGKGKVEAPIAHFVAATCVSRFHDLFFWYFRWSDKQWFPLKEYVFEFNTSAMIIVGFHIINLLLVADFMYYYIKARFNSPALSEDLMTDMDIPMDSLLI